MHRRCRRGPRRSASSGPSRPRSRARWLNVPDGTATSTAVVREGDGRPRRSACRRRRPPRRRRRRRRARRTRTSTRSSSGPSSWMSAAGSSARRSSTGLPRQAGPGVRVDGEAHARPVGRRAGVGVGDPARPGRRRRRRVGPAATTLRTQSAAGDRAPATASGDRRASAAVAQGGRTYRRG